MQRETGGRVAGDVIIVMSPERKTNHCILVTSTNMEKVIL